MAYIIPMPSPLGTNYERLFLSPLRGAAYDARGGLLGYDKRPTRDAAQDPVAVLQKWVIENLDDAAQDRLIEALASKPSRPAQDDEADPSLDPNDERFGPNGTLQRKERLNGARTRSAVGSRRTPVGLQLTSAFAGLVQRHMIISSAGS